MNKSAIKSIIATLVSLLFAYFIAKMNEPYVQELGGYSLYFLAGVLAFVINWIAFIPSYIAQTEHYYDLTGSITYLSILIFAFIYADISSNPRAILLTVLPAIWTIRLGLFLFKRIQKAGKDSRFDDIKPNFFRFFTSWTLQGLWAFITICAALAVITSTKQVDLGVFAIIGGLIWLFGFAVEVIADRQKSKFKENPDNEGKFISSGLWAHSRHPNYFGEITLWTGIFIICIPVLQGPQWVTILSPIFVYLLLKYVSGIKLLEKKADKKWGDQKDYQEYKEKTPELLLLP